MAFDPNDDFGMDDFNFDDLDFNIEDYTSQVDFDGGQGSRSPGAGGRWRFRGYG